LNQTAVLWFCLLRFGHAFLLLLARAWHMSHDVFLPLEAELFVPASTRQRAAAAAEPGSTAQKMREKKIQGEERSARQHLKSEEARKCC
jgi:hypothetical protein